MAWNSHCSRSEGLHAGPFTIYYLLTNTNDTENWPRLTDQTHKKFSFFILAVHRLGVPGEIRYICMRFGLSLSVPLCSYCCCCLHVMREKEVNVLFMHTPRTNGRTVLVALLISSLFPLSTFWESRPFIGSRLFKIVGVSFFPRGRTISLRAFLVWAGLVRLHALPLYLSFFFPQGQKSSISFAAAAAAAVAAAAAYYC